MKKSLMCLAVTFLISSASFAGVSCSESNHCMQLGYDSMASDDLKSASLYFREALKISAQDCAKNRVSRNECNENMEMATKQISMINTLAGTAQGNQFQNQNNYQTNDRQNDKQTDKQAELDEINDLIDLGNESIARGDYKEALGNLEMALSRSNRACKQSKSAYACDSSKRIGKTVRDIKSNYFYQVGEKLNHLNERCPNAFARMIRPMECSGLFK